jgi:D-sedoheptulose 7-phosphate isomerase
MNAEPTGFLYPFIEAEERDADALVTELVSSARSKMFESASLRAATLERCAQQVEGAATAMATRFARGGRLFSFGNGGSATDAQGTADVFCHPAHGKALPALSLVDDQAVLTALSNDVGFELIFSRQLIAYADELDIAIGFSTSGDSADMLRAFEEAARRGLLTVGLCGYEGSGMAVSDAVHHCLVVRSESVHRIQEVQDALTLSLWESVQRHLPIQTAAGWAL